MKRLSVQTGEFTKKTGHKTKEIYRVSRYYFNLEKQLRYDHSCVVYIHYAKVSKKF